MTFGRPLLELNGSNAKHQFERFGQIVGVQNIIAQMQRLALKFRHLQLSRSLFQDRYAIQLGIIRLAKRFRYFKKPDLNDTLQIRTLSFIAGVNAAVSNLNGEPLNRFLATLRAELSPGRDIRHMEHEIRCYIHFRQLNYKVEFADLSGERFDFLVDTGREQFEVECKTLSEHTGLNYDPERLATITEDVFTLSNKINEFMVIGDIEICIDYLSYSNNDIMPIKNDIEQAIRTNYRTENLSINVGIDRDFAIALEMYENGHELQSSENEIVAWKKTNHGRLIVRFRVDKPSTVIKRAVKVLKEASDQLSGNRPGICWLHFLGVSDEEFRDLVAHMDMNPHSGLNALASQAIHSSGDFSKRAHVVRVRFSASTSTLEQKPTFARNRLLATQVALNGPLYDAINPSAKFALSAKI